MITQRVNQRSLHLEEESKQVTNVGISNDLFPSNEVTQNILINSNFQPDMTANYVPQDMSNEIEKSSEVQKKSFAT